MGPLWGAHLDGKIQTPTFGPYPDYTELEMDEASRCQPGVPANSPECGDPPLAGVPPAMLPAAVYRIRNALAPAWLLLSIL